MPSLGIIYTAKLLSHIAILTLHCVQQMVTVQLAETSLDVSDYSALDVAAATDAATLRRQ